MHLFSFDKEISNIIRLIICTTILHDFFFYYPCTEVAVESGMFSIIFIESPSVQTMILTLKLLLKSKVIKFYFISWHLTVVKEFFCKELKIFLIG